nr:glutamyl-tRNA(Gln) amidotransferase subunit B, mitochondrial-like [Ciona intestinalis]|eukprot:XP_002127266.1 glutamyl-tRNA(Gln) amidotransferase subunit B, mitochondrial-like [Ciona intestinalis]
MMVNLIWNILCTRCMRVIANQKRHYVSEAKNIRVLHEQKWLPVIGLEVHAQINSRTKLFSSALNKFMAPPNSLVSEFDASMPGTLPVLNKECVRAAVLTSLALNCKINPRSTFDRKHYFYADMPHGYQITQHWNPIAVDGKVTFPTLQGQKSLRIERVQLEQDSGKSLHDYEDNVSLIDLNRAGVGLMEIVTFGLSNADDACAFVNELHLMLVTLGTCEGKMSEGQLRVDVNISLHKPGEPLGTRAEVKNINGMRILHQVIEHEILRQSDLLDHGFAVEQETRGYDDVNRTTYSMRDKEMKTDYRFMPEPNLPPLQLYDDLTIHNTCGDGINIDDIRREIPLLPAQLRKILDEKYKLDEQEIKFLLDREMVNYFIQVSELLPNTPPIEVYHWLKIKVVALLADNGLMMSQWPFNAKDFADLMSLKENNEINDSIAFEALTVAVKDKATTPVQVIENMGWKMISDITMISSLCDDVIIAMETENPEVFEKYNVNNAKSNKKIVAKVVGKVFKASQGKMHTAIIKKTVQDLLNEKYNTNV